MVPSSRLRMATAAVDVTGLAEERLALSAPVAETETTSRPVTKRRMSKSWTLQSQKMPPLVGMYASGGGDWSCVRRADRVDEAGSPPCTAWASRW